MDDVLARRRCESPEAYIARLESLDRAALDADGQLAFQLSLTLARKKLNSAAMAGLSSLHDFKEAIRKLPDRVREQLARWLTAGMPD
jgi:hypothetical protein